MTIGKPRETADKADLDSFVTSAGTVDTRPKARAIESKRVAKSFSDQNVRDVGFVCGQDEIDGCKRPSGYSYCDIAALLFIHKK